MLAGTVAAANASELNPPTPTPRVTRYMGDDDEYLRDPSNRLGNGLTHDFGAREVQSPDYDTPSDDDFGAREVQSPDYDTPHDSEDDEDAPPPLI